MNTKSLNLKSILKHLLSNRKRRLIVLGILVLFLGGLVYASLVLRRDTEASWWNGDSTGPWQKRQKLTIVNSNTTESLAVGTTIAVTVNTKTLVSQGKLQDDCDDLRILYQDGSTTTVLDRYISYPGGTTCGTSEASKVYFKIYSNALDAAETDTNYYMYYGNPQATSPSNPDNAFDIGAKDALLVCPFDGTTTCAAGETPSTSSGAIRYSGSKSALSFANDGGVDYINVGSPTTLDNLTTVTFELWYKLNSPASTNTLLHKSDYFRFEIICTSGNNQIWGRVSYTTTSASSTTSGFTCDNTWHHLAFVFDINGDKKMHIYLDGTEQTYNTQTAADGNRQDDSSYNLQIGKNNFVSRMGYKGVLDEIRISDTPRYTSSFTPSTAPLIRDSHTLLLYHLDENGNDPRQSGIAIDVSGNANHGTLNGGKYVSGLVGVDNGTTDTGKADGGNTYAGHEGIFIEEGTTNKITNPSFEHETYNTNWTASSSASITENTNPIYNKFGSQSTYLRSSPVYYDFQNESTYERLYYLTSNKRLAQGFQSAINFSPTEVSLIIGRSGSATRYFNVEIQTDNGGIPSGTPITNGATECVAYSTILDHWEITSLSFPTPPSLTASTQYHLVMRAFSDASCSTEYTSVDTTNNIWIRYDDSSSTYSGGSRATMNESGVWTSYTSTDHVFSLNADGSVLTNVNVGNTNQHTLSAYVFRYSYAENYGGDIDSSVANLIFNATPVATTYTDLGNGWSRLSYSAAGIDANTTYGLEVKSGKFVYVDGFQLEEKNQWASTPYATTYIDGSLGTGYAWTGTANESTSTRSSSYLAYNSSGNVEANSGTVSFWIKRNPSYEGDVFRWHESGGQNQYVVYAGTSTSATFKKSVGGVDTNLSSTLNYDVWAHVVATWSNSTGMQFCINNSCTSNASTTVPTNLPSTFNIGTTFSPIAPNGIISDYRIFNSALSTTEIADLYYSGLVSHSENYEVDAFSDDKGQDAVGLWHFDEAYGTTAHDSSRYGNDLTVSGASWHSTSAFPNALTLRHLHYDGTDDYAYKDWDREFDFGTDGFTLQGWFQHPSTISGTDTILARYSTAGWKVYMNTSGYICFGVDDDSTWGPDYSACSTTSYADSKWHHFDAVKDTSTITLYIDGNQVAQTGSVTQGSLSSSAKLYIGIDSDGTSNPWDADIDEVAIYPYAKTATQIKSDLTSSPIAQMFGMSLTGLEQGLAGYWKMDESDWTNDCATDSALDSSGNGNHGDSCPTTTGPDPASGKFGNGGSFDGSNDMLTIPDSSMYHPENITISIWTKFDQLSSNKGESQIVYRKKHSTSPWDSFMLLNSSTSNKFVAYIRDESSNQYTLTSSTVMTINTWYHITVVVDGKNTILYINGNIEDSLDWNGTSIFNSDTVLRVGADYEGANRTDGTLDEFRIYNRALSPAEVSQLYNWAPGPVGYWKMDEGSGTSSLYDSSGNGLTGTINGSMTQSDWVQGKYGSALDFDGTDDSISVGNNSSFVGQTGTWSFWAYLTDDNDRASGYGLIAYDLPGNDFNDSCVIFFSTSNRIQAHCRKENENPYSFNIATPINKAYANTWYHIALVQDGVAAKLYLNGILEATSSGEPDSGAWTADIDSSYNFYINKATGTDYVNAKIDDVKIYNYARTPAQIIEDMNAGHPAPGSPVGSPWGYWKFDEGSGVTQYNSGNGGTSINGASGGAVYTNSGKIGKAMSFDGVDDRIGLSDQSAYEGVTNLTWSMWVKPTTLSVDQCFFCNLNYYSATGRSWGIMTGGSDSSKVKVYVFTNNTDALTTNYAESPAGTLSNGTWTYVTAVYDGTQAASDRIKIYINGLPVTTTITGTITASGPASSTVNTRIGNSADWNVGTTSDYNGVLDEVKVYLSSLTADQVKQEYNQGKMAVFGATSTDASGNPSWSSNDEYCPPGQGSSCTAPVAEWKFDEATGTETRDTSGNGNNAALVNGPTWVPVPSRDSGWALDFPGTDDQVSAAANSVMNVTNLSMSAWIYPASVTGTQDVICKNRLLSGNDCTWALVLADDEVRFYSNNLGGAQTVTTTSANLSPNTWYHVTTTFQDSTNTTRIYINGQLSIQDTTTITQSFENGNSAIEIAQENNSRNYNGKIDNIRVYNYERTPAQIAWEYNQGGPVGYWKFDECTGVDINDSSVTDNHGTLTVGATGSNTSAGSCSSGISTQAWNNGTTGKRNASIDFDGTDDWASIADRDAYSLNTTGQLSLSFWYKPATLADALYLVNKRAALNYEWDVRTGASGAIRAFILQSDNTVYMEATSTTGLLTAGNWYHVTFTADNSSPYLRLYLNGILVAQDTTSSGSIANGTANIVVAKDGAGATYVDGQIDDVKVFNYALTAQQVKAVMNEGAVHFGP